MDTQITDQPTAHLAVPLVQQAQIVLCRRQGLVVAVVKNTVRPRLRLHLMPLSRIAGIMPSKKEIHIRERNRTARQHFRDGKLRP